MAKFIVKLNGTDQNPWHKYGLKANPFPQVAKYEYVGACMRMQSLGADPIPNVEYIRERLKGFSPEFVNVCCERFQKGRMVQFEVEYPGV